MSLSHEVALTLLDAFAANVVERRNPATYGHYATVIGRHAKNDGLAIGHAMHAIGAACVIRQLPVAPLYWVRPTDGNERAVFENDAVERARIIDSGDIDVMMVVAREYQYTAEDFAGVKAGFRTFLASGASPNWSPHDIWHEAFERRPAGESQTYYDRAMERYRELLADLRSKRKPTKNG